MSTAKHTPGPWKLVGFKRSSLKALEGANSSRIATIDFAHSYQSSDLNEINARLIAKAPEMLSALRHLCVILDIEALWSGGNDPRALLREIEDKG